MEFVNFLKNAAQITETNPTNQPETDSQVLGEEEQNIFSYLYSTESNEDYSELKQDLLYAEYSYIGELYEQQAELEEEIKEQAIKIHELALLVAEQQDITNSITESLDSLREPNQSDYALTETDEEGNQTATYTGYDEIYDEYINQKTQLENSYKEAEAALNDYTVELEEAELTYNELKKEYALKEVERLEHEQELEICYRNGEIENIGGAAEFSSISEGMYIDSIDGESKDGEIGEIQQHSTGDCWLLSGIIALSYTEKGQEIIKDALDYQDGYTIVNLYTGSVIITDSEIAATKGSTQYSSGDDDMIIFERAIEKTLDAIADGEIDFGEDIPSVLEEDIKTLKSTTTGNSSTVGGYSIEAIYFLTGIEGTETQDKSQMNDELDKYMENDGQDYVLTASVNSQNENGEYKKVYVEDVNGNSIALINIHAYAIKSTDEDTVTVINPWNSGEEIVLSRVTFLDSFSSVESVDLSQYDNNKNTK